MTPYVAVNSEITLLQKFPNFHVNRVFPPPSRLHIDDRRTRLCQGDRRTAPKGVSRDKAVDPGSLRPRFDDSPRTGGSQPFAGNIIAPADTPKQRSLFYTCPAGANKFI